MKAARAQAERWGRDAVELQVRPTIQRDALVRIREQISRIAGQAMVRPQLDRTRLTAVREQINRTVGRISVRPQLEAAALRTIRERINAVTGRVNVRLGIAAGELTALRERLRATRMILPVHLRIDRDSLALVRARLAGLGGRIDLDIDLDSDGALARLVRQLAEVTNATDRATNSARRFGNESSGAFRRADGAMRLFIGGMPLLLPLLATAVQAAVGLGGALVSAFVTAGASLGAFGLVAVPVFKQIQEGAKGTREEIAKLPPGIREGANALKTLQEEYGKLVERTRENVGLALAAGFSAATAAVKTLDPVINATAQALVRIGQDIERYFGTAHWAEFVDFLAANVGPTFDSIWRIVSQLTRAVMELTIAFNPLAQWLLAAIADGMERFANWASTLANDPSFHAWLEDVKLSLESVWNFLVSVTQFLFALANALAPVGRIVADLLTAVFSALSRMPPEWLAGIAGGLSAVMAALLFGASPAVAAVVGVIAGVAFAMTTLYNSSERLRGALDPIINTIRDIFQPVFERLADLVQQRIIPAFQRIGDTIINELLPAFNDFLTAAGPFIAFFTEQVGVVAIDAFEKLLEIVDYTLKEISSALRFWAAVFRGDWDAAWDEIQVSFDLKMGLIETLFGDMWRDLTTTMQEEGQQLSDEWDRMWEDIKNTLTEEGDILKSEWETMLDDIGTTLREEGEIWKGIWNDIWSFFSGGGDTQEGNAGGGDVGFLDSIKESFEQFRTDVTESWHGFWAGLLDGLGLNGDQIVNGWNEKWNEMLAGANAKWEEIKLAWDLFWIFISGKVTEGGAALTEAWNSFWDTLWIKAFEIWETIKLGWNDFWTTGIGGKLTEQIGIIQMAWNLFWDTLFLKATEIWETIKLGWDLFWAQFGTSQETGQTTSSVSWGEWFRTLGETIGTSIAGWLETWNNFWANLGISQETAQAISVTSLATWVTNMITTFSGFVVQFLALAQGAWNNFVAGLSGMIVQAIAQFNNLRTQAVAAVTNLVTQVIAGFNNLRAQAVAAITNLITQAVSQFNNMRTQVVSAVTTLVTQAVAAFRRLADQALSILRSLPGQMASIGRSIVQGIISGVNNAAGSLFSALRSLASRALAAARNAIGANSPSKLFRDEVGMSMGEGIIVGIRNMIPKVIGAVRGLTDEISPDGQIEVMSRGQISVGPIDTASVSFDGQSRDERIASVLEEIRDILERGGLGTTVNQYGTNSADDDQAARLALRFT